MIHAEKNVFRAENSFAALCSAILFTVKLVYHVLVDNLSNGLTGRTTTDETEKRQDYGRVSGAGHVFHAAAGSGACGGGFSLYAGRHA